MKHLLIDYFPTKLAQGEQFCNRVAEQTTLKGNIELARHTVLVSPRRYGKSSLVHQVACHMDMPFEAIDLFLANDDKTVTKRLLNGISNLISQIIPISQKALIAVQKYFTNFKVGLNAGGFDLEFTYKSGTPDTVDQILDALQSLAKLAEEKKQKVLFFIDEFQDIAAAENAKAMQGAIRHVAQETAWIVFVFSGSNRHLLLDLFDDSNQPLYMLCDKIILDRMLSEHYYPHIQQAAKNRWGQGIDETVLNRILTLTELHPFYVNLLCHELWKNSTPPILDDVMTAWSLSYEIEERRLVSELEKLTVNQQDILKALALNPTQEPSSQEFLSLTGLSLSSVRTGMKTLQEKDMIYVVKKEDPNLPFLKSGQYRVLDPLLAYTLRKYS